ncbi:hypothetical protein BGZ89_002696 [Linnemannia elongata]|nr:hypothetical protein BGZ89_002696 [Linnemannia elongata]
MTLDSTSNTNSTNSSLHSVSNTNGRTVLEGQLIDLSLDNNNNSATKSRISVSGSTEDDDDDAATESLNNNGATTDARNGDSTVPAPATTPTGGARAGVTAGRIPTNIPSTAEMENLPNDVVALILETLTILELYDLHTLSDRWRQLTTRALLDKFMQSHVVLWADQEGHRTFRPVFLFDSFDEATNRIRWLPKPVKPEFRGQVYSKTFGITKPVIRIISVGDTDKYDYLDKEAQMSILKPGTRTLLGSDKGCPWAFIYKVSSFTRKGKKINGERWIEPVSFECHLDFLNPRRAHKLRLLWYLQKSYSAMPLVGNAAQKQVNRSKVEGAVAPQQMSEFFSGNQSHHLGVLPGFR